MDEILHITLEGGAARAMVAVTTGLVEKARQTHGLSAVASAALGRTLTAGAILGVMMKNPTDNLTVSIRGGGPIGPVVCVAHADGAVKGYVGDPQLELPPKPNGKLDVGGAVGSTGHITVVRDLGLRDLEQTISDVRGVDIHMAHAHILSDYNDVLSEDVSAELFNRMAIEIMKAVNFYNYNNRERSLRRIYLCGGGVAVDQIRAAICRVTDLDVHNAEELLPQHDALEAAWLYIKAIGCALQK